VGGGRRRFGRGKRWGELDTREGESEKSGDGRTSGAASGNGPSAALVGDVRRAHVAGENRVGREASDRWVVTVPGDGAADRRVRPISGAGERRVRARGRAWAGPRRKGDGPPGCTIRFCIYLN
jgi:hypothetical protein